MAGKAFFVSGFCFTTETRSTWRDFCLRDNWEDRIVACVLSYVKQPLDFTEHYDLFLVALFWAAFFAAGFDFTAFLAVDFLAGDFFLVAFLVAVVFLGAALLEAAIDDLVVLLAVFLGAFFTDLLPTIAPVTPPTNAPTGPATTEPSTAPVMPPTACLVTGGVSVPFGFDERVATPLADFLAMICFLVRDV
jgi:hypothetical protein